MVQELPVALPPVGVGVRERVRMAESVFGMEGVEVAVEDWEGVAVPEAVSVTESVAVSVVVGERVGVMVVPFTASDPLGEGVLVLVGEREEATVKVPPPAPPEVPVGLAMVVVGEEEEEREGEPLVEKV